MRGKLLGGNYELARERNIPAYAGKTFPHRMPHNRRKEHPRVCGENSAAAARSGDPGGTSPRMRGKLLGGNYELARERNIPAYAGKTNSFPPLPM